MALDEYYNNKQVALHKRLLKILLFLVVASVVIGGAFALTLFSPSRTGGKSAEQTKASITHADPKILEESEAMIREFDTIEYKREVSETDIDILGKALKLREAYYEQKDFVNVVELQDTRNLRKRLHDLRAKPLVDEALGHVEASRRLQALQKLDEARVEMAHAVRLQGYVNSEYSLSDYASVSRYTRYERQLRELTATPLFLQSKKLEKQSEQAADEGDWEQAKQYLEQAIHLQAELITDYSGFPVADMPRLRKLERDLISYESLNEYLEIESLIKQAEQAESSGQLEEAASFFEKARTAQSALNRKYPGSRFAVAERENVLLRRAQTALSRDDAKPILLKLESFNQGIRAQDVNRVLSLSGKLLSELETFRRRYPRSDALPVESLERVTFISIVGNDLDALFERIRQGLIDIDENKRLYGKLVQQDVFRWVTGSNPSRERDVEQAVDSVNYNDIEIFCDRLSWLLGRAVRLPHVSELRQWGEAISLGGVMHEWCVDEEGKTFYADWADGLRLEAVNMQSRSRVAGFRFVVESGIE